MEPVSPPPILPKPSFFKRAATVFKLIGVGFLILVMLIPLGMIGSILRERLERRNAAVSEITATWGHQQKLVGPVLIVPYRYSFKSWKEQPDSKGKIERVEVVETAVAKAYFLPASLAVDGSIAPRQLHRGIYQAIVYDGNLNISAQFTPPDFASLHIAEADIIWDDALVTFAIPDLRGIKDNLQLQWGTATVQLMPGCKLRDFPAGVSARINVRDAQGPIDLKLQLSLNGSEGIHFTPVGAKTTVRLKSPWPDPRFEGAYLPTERSVTPTGFEARWDVSFYGRDFGQQWTDRDNSTNLTPAAATQSQFGVDFLAGIDTYRNVERAIKYGALFLVLVFATFFLFEVLARLRIHPFQYLLVGADLCLFYLGLLALSEFIPFGTAYLATACVVTLLIWFYCAKVQIGRAHV